MFGFGWKYLKIIWLSNLLDFEWVDLKSFILAEIYKKKLFVDFRLLITLLVSLSFLLDAYMNLIGTVMCVIVW